MCYSANVSAGTFLFVAAGAYYMWQRNRGIDRPLALMLLFIAFMQVLEWILWLNLDCGAINKLITAIIPVYLVLQPVVLNWIVGAWGAGWGKGWGVSYGIVAAAAAALLVPARLYAAVKNYGDCAHLNTAGHLVWPGVPFDSFVPYIYYITLIYPIVTLNNSAFAALYLLFATASHYMFGRSNKEAWPSMWCHFVNLLTVFAVLRPT